MIFMALNLVHFLYINLALGHKEGPEEKARRIDEERRRTIYLTGCPPTAAGEDLWQLFPNAEDVHIFRHDGKVTGTAVVRFQSVREAEEAAMTTTVEVKGKAVRVALRGVLACFSPFFDDAPHPISWPISKTPGNP